MNARLPTMLHHIARLLRKAQFWQYALAAFFIAAAGFFLKKEAPELAQMPSALGAARPFWVAVGLALTVLFVLVQGVMYWFSFRAVGVRASLFASVWLYLKRNLVAVFLPAGNFTSLAFFNDEVRKREGVENHKTVVAGLIHGIASFASIAVVALPVLGLLFLRGGLSVAEVLAFAGVVALIAAMLYLFFDALRGGALTLRLVRRFPGIQKTAQTLQNERIDWRAFHAVWLWSCVIEAIGIAHLYVAMQAVGGSGDWATAAIGYVIVLLWLSISPVFRGLGAVEVSLALVLAAYGWPMAEALTVTALFRFFEFWSVLLLGGAAFLRGTGGLLLRVATPVFVFLLGLVNVWSAVTPAMPERMHLLRDFLPLETIHYSNLLVLTAGLALLLTGVYLLRGLLAAWWLALALTLFSIVGHLVKGFDFEEALLGVAALFALFYTRNQYFIKTDRSRTGFPVKIFAATVFAGFVYGAVGFYFLDKKMFGYDFTWQQSITYTLKQFLLLDTAELRPLTTFGAHFLTSISVAGMLAALTGVYYWLRPRILKIEPKATDLAEAKALTERYGHSSLDYFKTYFDKLIFFTADRQSFVSYKIARSYAVVLEEPVAPDAAAAWRAIREFEQFCRESGLRALYYRVREQDLDLFKGLNFKMLHVGQEAVADVRAFTLEGKEAKALRNAVSRAAKENVVFRVYQPPVRLGILQKLKAVSDEWLAEGRREIGFSGGIFDMNELRGHTVLTIENEEEQIIAFMNLVPDFTPGGATYDLIRRLPGAPGWVIDFLMASLFTYLKESGYETLNMGLAPMSGVSNKNSLPERALRLAYSRVKSFAHYHGLRAFKEKFATAWQNQYLIYASDADLVAAAGVLAEVERVQN